MVIARSWLARSATRHLAAALVAVPVAAWSAPARADAGIPMLALMWPFSWLAFVPVVLIEAHVAARMFGLGHDDALKLALKANAWSTLVGIPATWFLLLLIELLTMWLLAGPPGSPDATMSWILTPLLLAWIPDSRPWAVAAIAAGLCVPFYFMSVWVEAWSARSRLPATDARRWARRANAITYGLCILVLAVVGLYAAGTPARGEDAVPPPEYRDHRPRPHAAKVAPEARDAIRADSAATGTRPR
jgi:hypothetical protein